MALNTDYIFLSIYMKHRVRDMSVGNSFDNKMAPIPYADLRAGEEIDCSRIRGGKVRVVDVVPERITLEAEGKTYELELEEKVGCGDYAVDKGMAATNNDPNEFIDDKDLYYDLLATAAEEGCDEARDIMNEIWPPEQIIEED